MSKLAIYGPSTEAMTGKLAERRRVQIQNFIFKKKSYHEHDGLHNRRARTRVCSLHILHSRHLRCGDRSCVRTHRHDRRMVPPGSRTPDRTHSGGLNRWEQGHPPVWGQLRAGRGRRLRLRCRVLGGELGTGSWLAWIKKCVIFFGENLKIRNLNIKY